MSTLTGVVIYGGGGNLAVRQTTDVSGTFEVIYTYADPTEVPEPVSIALLGTGLLGLGFVRLRGRRG